MKAKPIFGLLLLLAVSLVYVLGASPPSDDPTIVTVQPAPVSSALAPTPTPVSTPRGDPLANIPPELQYDPEASREENIRRHRERLKIILAQYEQEAEAKERERMRETERMLAAAQRPEIPALVTPETPFAAPRSRPLDQIPPELRYDESLTREESLRRHKERMKIINRIYLEEALARDKQQPVGGPHQISSANYPDLQTAIDALPASGGLVMLAPGTYELKEPLVVTRGDVRIVGAGTATHIVNRNETGQPALLIRPPSGEAKKAARIWRVQLADFRVSGNPKSGDGVRAEGVNEILIDNLAVDHNGGHGLHLIDCYEDPRIVDSILTYNGGAGLHLQACHDIVVNGNQFEENQDALQCIDSFNLCMNGNNLDDHLRHGVVIENTYGSVVAGNMIEECQGTAVILDRDCYGITISANVIAHEAAGGVDLRDAWGCAISANTFTIVAGQALTVGPDSGRIAITGNNFSNAWIGGKTKRDDVAAGILLRGTTDIAVAGNVFAGLTGEAVRIEGESKGVTQSGNVTVDVGKPAPAPAPATR